MANDQIDIKALRAGMEKVNDWLVGLSTDLAQSTPKPETLAQAQKVVDTFGLGMAPPDTEQQDEDEDVDQNGVPLPPAARAAKRARKSWNAAFREKSYATKRREEGGVSWPSDMSTPEHHDAAIAKTLGKRAPKKA